MSLWTVLKATLVEDDGSLAMAEVNTACFALVLLLAAGRYLFDSSHDFPFLSVAGSVGTINVAYGLAKWIREGKWRPGDGESK